MRQGEFPPNVKPLRLFAGFLAAGSLSLRVQGDFGVLAARR